MALRAKFYLDLLYGRAKKLHTLKGHSDGGADVERAYKELLDAMALVDAARGVAVSDPELASELLDAADRR